MVTFAVCKNKTQLYSTNYINPFYINSSQALLDIGTNIINDNLKQIHINDEVITVLVKEDFLFLSLGREISYNRSIECLKEFVEDYNKMSLEELDMKYI